MLIAQTDWYVPLYLATADRGVTALLISACCMENRNNHQVLQGNAPIMNSKARNRNRWLRKRFRFQWHSLILGLTGNWCPVTYFPEKSFCERDTSDLDCETNCYGNIALAFLPFHHPSFIQAPFSGAINGLRITRALKSLKRFPVLMMIFTMM